MSALNFAVDARGVPYASRELHGLVMDRPQDSARRYAWLGLTAGGAALAACEQVQVTSRTAVPESDYTKAFASFAPVNADIFIAAADDSDARPLVADPRLTASTQPATWARSTNTRLCQAEFYEPRALLR